MEIKRGGAEVKKHAIEAGIDEDLTRIIAAFGGKAAVKDIAIITPGKMTYIHEKPTKSVRVIPGGLGRGVTLKQAIKAVDEQAKQRKLK